MIIKNFNIMRLNNWLLGNILFNFCQHTGIHSITIPFSPTINCIFLFGYFRIFKAEAFSRLNSLP